MPSLSMHSQQDASASLTKFNKRPRKKAFTTGLGFPDSSITALKGDKQGASPTRFMGVLYRQVKPDVLCEKALSFFYAIQRAYSTRRWIQLNG